MAQTMAEPATLVSGEDKVETDFSSGKASFIINIIVVLATLPFLVNNSLSILDACSCLLEESGISDEFIGEIGIFVFSLFFLPLFIYLAFNLASTLYKIIFSLVTFFFTVLISNSLVEGRSIEPGVYLLIMGFIYVLFYVFAFSVDKKANETVIKVILVASSFLAITTVLVILYFLMQDAYPLFSRIGLLDFLLGKRWTPNTLKPEDTFYGAYPLILGTFLVTFGALVIAVPLGLGSAIYIAELAPYKAKLVIKPVAELLAGIPSIVYGFFGMTFLVVLMQDFLRVPSGSSWFAGSVILGIMALPTITSVAEDAITAVPREFKEGSLAVGATKWQTISGVTLPSALSGITAAVILGMGRAIGETMAVLLVTGNKAVIPEPFWDVFDSVRTITGALGIELGETAYGTIHYTALFGLAVILLIITLIVNLASIVIIGRIKAQQTRKAATFSLSNVKRIYQELNRDNANDSGYAVTHRNPNFKQLLFTILVALMAVAFMGIAAVFVWFVFYTLSIAEIIVISVGLIAIAIIYKISKHIFYDIVDRLTPQEREKIAFSIIYVVILVVLSALTVIVGFILINGLPNVFGLTFEEMVVVLIVVVVIFLVLYAIHAVSNRKLYPFIDRINHQEQRRISSRFIYKVTSISLLIILGVILVLVVISILPVDPSLEFLLEPPRKNGREGGIFPAIIGTIELVAGAILFALPIGVCAAIFLVEYRKEGKATKLVRTGFDLLNGTPSIVFGLFAFAFLVIYLRFGISMITGQITLGLMILPTCLRTTEESLKSVPRTVREGSLALGASKWQTVRNVVLPPSLPGILTGAILSIGRAAGETAPIMFTAVVLHQRYLADSLFEPVMALPYHLFMLATNIPGTTKLRFATAAVLLIFVCSIYLVAIILRNRYSKRFQW